MELRDIRGQIMGVISDAMMEGDLSPERIADAILAIPEIRDALAMRPKAMLEQWREGKRRDFRGGDAY